MNNTFTPSTTSGPDPRCPHCGRPVLGAFVQGSEGRYHPECVQSPHVAPGPVVIPSAPPWVNPYPYPCNGITWTFYS